MIVGLMSCQPMGDSLQQCHPTEASGSSAARNSTSRWDKKRREKRVPPLTPAPGGFQATARRTLLIVLPLGWDASMSPGKTKVQPMYQFSKGQGARILSPASGLSQNTTAVSRV